MPQSLNKLVQMVRQKYPDAYRNVDDAALTKAVLAKYPQYSPLAVPGVSKPGLPLSTGDKAISALDDFSRNPYAQAAGNIGDQLTTGVNIGAVKALGRHLIGGTNLVRQGLNAVGVSRDPLPTPGFLQPKNPGETVGGVLEGMGEFLIPEAWAGKVRKSGMLAKAAYTGATQGLTQSVQQGEANLSTAVAAGMGIMSSLGADALTATGQKYLPRLFNKGLVPSRADLANGANPGKAVMDEGIVGNTYQQIADKADELKTQVGKQTDSLLQSPQHSYKRVDLQPSINRVDDLTDLARSKQQAGVAEEFANMRERFTHDVIPDPSNPTHSITVPRGPSTQSLTQVSPYQANLIKRGLGDFTMFGSSPSAMQAGNQMNQSVMGGLNDSILGEVPELAPLNSRYQNLRSLAISSGRRAEFVDRSGRKMLGPLLGANIGFLGGGLEGYREHGVLGAIGGSVAGSIVGSISGGMTNPMVVTHSMQALPQLNPFLTTLGAGALSTYNNGSDFHGTNP
jgi:hypothetical protein